MRKLHLPASMASNQIAIKLGQYISMMGPSSTYFSAIVYQEGNGLRFLNKDQEFPFVEFDWMVYCSMRSWAKTIITSGTTLRNEPNGYNDSHSSFGKSEILELFEKNTAEKQKLIVLTRSMTDEQIMQIAAPKCYQLVKRGSLVKEQDICMRSYVEAAIKQQMGPILLENGYDTMEELLFSYQGENSNPISMVILSVFEGAMPEHYIGKPFITKWMEDNMQNVWVSPKIETSVNKNDGTVEQGSIKFTVYLKKEAEGA